MRNNGENTMHFYMYVLIFIVIILSCFLGYDFLIESTSKKQNIQNELAPNTDLTYSDNESRTNEVLLTDESSTVQHDADSKPNDADKVMYLTFDDGPSDYTKQIVDILNQYKIKGTFYFIGKNVAGREESVKYAAESGHTIGLHSMTHNKHNIYNEDDIEAFVNELYEVQSILEPLIGYKTYSTRAPYGSNHMPLKSFEAAGDAGFKLWDWSIDTNDWQEGVTEQSIMDFLTAFPAENREILLEHELPVTLEVLPKIIEFYQNNGYQFKSHDTNTHFSYNFFRDKRY